MGTTRRTELAESYHGTDLWRSSVLCSKYKYIQIYSNIFWNTNPKISTCLKQELPRFETRAPLFYNPACSWLTHQIGKIHIEWHIEFISDYIGKVHIERYMIYGLSSRVERAEMSPHKGILEQLHLIDDTRLEIGQLITLMHLSNEPKLGNWSQNIDICHYGIVCRYVSLCVN